MSETIAQSQSENYSKSVGTSAVVLVKGGGNGQAGSGIVTVGGTINVPRSVVVHNAHASQVLYVGWGSDVTSSSGFPIAAGGYMEFDLLYTDELWAVGSGADTDARLYVLHGKGNPPFNLLDLSPTLWLDASDTSTISDTAGAVDTWSDKSGNSNDVVQATADNKPTTGTRTINSLNVLDFDGSDYMRATYGAALSQPATIFSVFSLDNASAQSGIVDDVSFASSRRWNVQMFSDQYRLLAATAIAGGTTGTTPVIVAAVADGASSLIRVDGTQVVSGNAGTAGSNGVTIGALYNAGAPLDGAIAEIIIVNSTLSGGQIADTETYLAAKWGITI